MGVCLDTLGSCSSALFELGVPAGWQGQPHIGGGRKTLMGMVGRPSAPFWNICLRSNCQRPKRNPRGVLLLVTSPNAMPSEASKSLLLSLRAMGHFATCSTIILFSLLAAGVLTHLQPTDEWKEVLGRKFLAAGALRDPQGQSAAAASSPLLVPKIQSSLQDLIQRLPKAELHIHIEGTLEAAMMMRLAERNNVSLPYKSVEEAEAARCA